MSWAFTPKYLYFHTNFMLLIKNSFFLKKNTGLIIIDFYKNCFYLFYFSNKTLQLYNINLYSLKNIIKIYSFYLASNYKLLVLDYGFSFFNVINLQQLSINKNIYFFKFKKTHVFGIFNLLAINTVKLILIFDLKYFYNYIYYFNLFNINVWSISNINNRNLLIDCFFYTSYISPLLKLVLYSYFFSVWSNFMRSKLNKMSLDYFVKVNGFFLPR